MKVQVYQRPELSISHCTSKYKQIITLPIKWMGILRVPPIQILYIINRIDHQQLAPTQVTAAVIGATTPSRRPVLVEVELSLVRLHVS